MTRQSPKNDYDAARRAVNRHLWHHHAEHRATGTLEQRLRRHDDIHWEAQRAGEELGHAHAILEDDETLEQVAQRYFDEGKTSEVSSG
jgi:hypothetical protein